MMTVGGGRSGKRPVGEHMLRLDVRFLHRNDWLRPGLSIPLNWFWWGEPVASVSVVTSPDSIYLLYSTRDGEHVDETVLLNRTPCHYGGTRT